MAPTSPNLNLRGRPAVPVRVSWLRNFYFWTVVAVAFFATATWSAAISFSDRAAMAVVLLSLLSWVAFGTSFLWRIVSGMRRHEVPSVAEIEKWDYYHFAVCELSAKVHQKAKARLDTAASAKRTVGHRNWKRGALASATLSIRSRSFFDGPEEAAEERLRVPSVQ